MKPIALAQQIVLLDSWHRESKVSEESMESMNLFLPYRTMPLRIPRNPEAHARQIAQEVFEIEGFGFSPVHISAQQYTVDIQYNPEVYAGRTVSILRLFEPVKKRGEELRYVTIYRKGSSWAIRYSRDLYTAMFKARPSLATSVTLNDKERSHTLPGVCLLHMKPKYLAFQLSLYNPEEIDNLKQDSLQCNALV